MREVHIQVPLRSKPRMTILLEQKRATNVGRPLTRPDNARLCAISHLSGSSCHCEPTGRAYARPMTDSAKQSMPQHGDRWIASLRSQ
jgi:hypothetical protein